MPISKCRQNDGHDRSYLGVKSCKSTGESLMKWLLLYLKLKFTKNNEKTMKHLWFKIDPVPAESAEICHFDKRWLKSFLHATSWLIAHETWYNILENLFGAILQQKFVTSFTKNQISAFGK